MQGDLKYRICSERVPSAIFLAETCFSFFINFDTVKSNRVGLLRRPLRNSLALNCGLNKRALVFICFNLERGNHIISYKDVHHASTKSEST